MNVSFLVWGATLVALLALLLIDLIIIGRRPHEPSVRESSWWVVTYVTLAGIFGLIIYLGYGGRYAGEFFAGWLTEYSLSVDNLFVFVIIMARFAVPRIYQQRVLLIGIVLALIMRGMFIAAGAAIVSRFVWVFYLFGAFLVYTAVKLAKQGGDEDDGDFKENPLIRVSRRVLPIARSYDGVHAVTRQNHRLVFTPMFVVMVAIGTTDLIFALDSIPAIFGLTKEPYLIFTANVFALMGLRQLYFLLGNLLDRLIYLSVGLSFVLGFIGVKLVLEALHDNNVPFINGGEPVSWAPQIPIWLSLTVIVAILATATIASLHKARTLSGVPAGAASSPEPARAPRPAGPAVPGTVPAPVPPRDSGVVPAPGGEPSGTGSAAGGAPAGGSVTAKGGITANGGAANGGAGGSRGRGSGTGGPHRSGAGGPHGSGTAGAGPRGDVAAYSLPDEAGTSDDAAPATAGHPGRWRDQDRPGTS